MSSTDPGAIVSAASQAAAISTVTVAVPVYNGGDHLPGLLDAIDNQHLDMPVDVEILISDSGSTDDSVAIAERHGARVIAIDKSDFSHGGTRNMLVSEARGEIVCFLTQDAEPATDRWLASIIEAFAQADDVALVFGPHIARAGHSPSIAREMNEHFKTWGGGTEIELMRLDRSPEGLAAYRAFPGRIQFFSDVNGAVAKHAWRQIPYREIPYAEDQLIGREMIEAGFAKVFHPGAAVIHSHDYGPINFTKRYFDEYRSLREVLGHIEPRGLKHVARNIAGGTKADARYLREQGVGGVKFVRLVLRAALHHATRAVGSILGSRANRLPPGLRRLLSLEGRDSFEPYELPASALDASSEPAAAGSDPTSEEHE